jgi:hypothetical protein
MVALLAPLSFASSGKALRAQTIEIKLVYGKTGHPVAGACVGVRTNDTRMSVTIKTDKDGVARLRLTYKDNEVDLSNNLKLRCGGDGAINPVLKYDDTLKTGPTFDNPSCAFPESMPHARWKEIDFSTKEVLQHGVISANTCGKVTTLPQPGQVILFVRPRNFHEKVQDWHNNEAFPL